MPKRSERTREPSRGCETKFFLVQTHRGWFAECAKRRTGVRRCQKNWDMTDGIEYGNGGANMAVGLVRLDGGTRQSR